MNTTTRINASDAATVRLARGRLGMTQTQFAEALRLTQGAIAQLERGRVRLTPRVQRRIDELIAAVEAEEGSAPRCTDAGAREAVRPFAAHLPTCPACLRQAYGAIARDRGTP